MISLSIRQTKERGLGVFAERAFKKGELIECCHVLITVKEEIRIGLSSSVMRNYVIEWENRFAIPTGYGCFYNHSYQPNAIHVKYIDLSEIHFYALRDIELGEEITFNYGGYPSYNGELWFEVKDS